MQPAYLLRAVATSPLPRRAPEYITLAVQGVDAADFTCTCDGLYPWMLSILRKDREFGLYVAEFGLLDDEDASDVQECFREELLLWDGSRVLLRGTRDLRSSLRSIPE